MTLLECDLYVLFAGRLPLFQRLDRCSVGAKVDKDDEVQRCDMSECEELPSRDEEHEYYKPQCADSDNTRQTQVIMIAFLTFNFRCPGNG